MIGRVKVIAMPHTWELGEDTHGGCSKGRHEEATTGNTFLTNRTCCSEILCSRPQTAPGENNGMTNPKGPKT